MQHRSRDGRLVSVAVPGREGMGVLYYELEYGQLCFHRLVEEMSRLGVRSADFLALIDLARHPLPDMLRNTGIIWAMGPMRSTGISVVVGTVVSGLSTDADRVGIVQAGVSIHGIDQCFARYSFLVQTPTPNSAVGRQK